MTGEVPWRPGDILHDDPGSFPLEDYLPLNFSQEKAGETLETAKGYLYAEVEEGPL